MIDGDRVYPVEYFFIHHSTGPDFVNASDEEVRQWYSDTGYGRGYNYGALNPRHTNPSDGSLSYAMAQFTMREYTLDGNRYGYRITDLIDEPWANVTWSVGNWFYNQRSCSVEVCGNFLGKVLPDKALMCLADFLRPVDEELGGILKLWLHQEVFSTACPARIAEQRDKVVDMINDPDKWNNALFGAPEQPQAPANPHKDVPAAIALEKPITVVTKLDEVELWDLDTNPNYVSKRTFTKGSEIDAVAYIPFNGIKYYQTQYSFNKNKWGINEGDVTIKAAPAATPKEEPTSPTTTPATTPSRDDEQDLKINGIMDLLRAIGEAFTKFLAKFKK